MNRYVALALFLAWPLGAEAFQPIVRHYDGVTITARQSASQPCGVDVNIAVNNYDTHDVRIDYTYTGSFDAYTFNGVYQPQPNLGEPSLRTDPKSGSILVQVGRNTRHGVTLTIFADPRGLYCQNAWGFNFIAATRNLSQGDRDYRAEQDRKKQAHIDEINRKKAEQAENKRRAEEQQRKWQQTQEQARVNSAIEYRKRPENARCLISISDERSTNESIRLCEQVKARMREQNAQEAAAAAEAQRMRDAEARVAAEQAARQREIEEGSRRMQADPCGFAAERTPPTLQQIRQYEAYNTISYRAMATQLRQWLAAVQAQCTASRSPAPSPAPTAQTAAPPVQPVATQPQTFSPSPQAQAASTADPCENLRKAYESDPKNLALAYQLRRCIKKARKAVQVQ